MNTKEDTIIDVHHWLSIVFPFYGSHWGPSTVWLTCPHSSKYFLMFSRSNTLMGLEQLEGNLSDDIMFIFV